MRAAPMPYEVLKAQHVGELNPRLHRWRLSSLVVPAPKKDSIIELSVLVEPIDRSSPKPCPASEYWGAYRTMGAHGHAQDPADPHASADPPSDASRGAPAYAH